MDRKSSSYCKATDSAHLEYCDCTKESNRLMLESFVRLFDVWIGAWKDFYAICATGSDGRLEKGMGSPLEFLVFAESKRGLGWMTSEILTSQLTMNERNIELSRDNVEVRDVTSDSMAYYHNDSARLFPTRVFDSRFVYGNADIYDAAKQKLFEEFRSEEGKVIIDKLSDRKREYRKVTETGTQRYSKSSMITQFDLDKGVCYFNPQTRQDSFKHGPLRLVQLTLMQGIASLSRKQDPDTFIKVYHEMPGNTEDKLLYLLDHDMLKINSSQVAGLIDSYKYFIWLYNKSQELYYFEGRTELQFDRKEVAEKSGHILNVLSKPIMI